MKKTNTQKGITLIALIITIIVLLILAVVAIGAVQNDGIIQHAKNAKNEYQTAQNNEQTTLENYLTKLDENSGSSTSIRWTQNGTTVTNGTITLEVGDTVDYVSNANANYYEFETNYEYDDDGEIVDEWEEAIEVTGIYEEIGGGWKILGAENGQILLMSTISVYEDDEAEGGFLQGGNLNGVTQLNTICEAFGQGKHATGARSIKVEDINRVTGYNPRNVGVYDPQQTGNGTVYRQGYIDEYGNEVTYTLEDGVIYYSGTNEVSGNDDGENGGYFVMPDETRLTEDNSITLTSTGYEYYPTTLDYSQIGDIVGLTRDSEAYKMLFRNEANTSNTHYWLGSSIVVTDVCETFLGLRYVAAGVVRCYPTWWTVTGENEGSFGVRAVVYLDSNVTLTSNGTNSWTLSE